MPVYEATEGIQHLPIPTLLQAMYKKREDEATYLKDLLAEVHDVLRFYSEYEAMKELSNVIEETSGNKAWGTLIPRIQQALEE